MRILITLILAVTTFGASQAQRKFTPILGSDTEVNRTLTFITENLVLDSLTSSRLSNLEGYIRCVFYVDLTGKISDIKVAKGLATWIDYEILNAMTVLPKMHPFTDRKGEAIRVKRDVYFTFGSTDERGWGNPYLGKPEQTTASIESQRKAQVDKIMKDEKAWNDFTTDNTKVSLDGKSVYKPGVLPNNPLKIKLPNTPPPPIKLTIKSDERKD